MIEASWEMAEHRPKRVMRIEQTVHWRELPEERLATADRLVELCPIHATLDAGTEVTSRVRRE